MEKEEKRKGMNNNFVTNLKLTYKYAKTGRKYLFLFLISNILLTIISVVTPYLAAKRLVSVTNGLWDRLLLLIIIIFVIEIFRNLTRYVGNYFYNKFYFDVRRNIQLELTKETLKITQEELNTNSTGVFIERINNDSDNLTDIFAALIDYFTAIIGNLGILFTVYVINIYIGIAYTLFIIVIIFLNKYTSGVNYKNRKIWKKSREKTGGFISEIVRGARDIKILDAEKSFLKKANLYLSETNEISYKYQRVKAKNRFFVGTVRDIGDLIISILFYSFLVLGTLSIESVIIIYSYHNQIIWTAEWIEGMYEVIKQFNLASNRIFGILDGDEFNKEVFGNKRLKKFDGNIEFKDVCFSYEDNLPVLKNMNFKINANQTIGFVGISGSGKSTIFNLISALNKPNSGNVFFDGIDISTLNKSSIRGNLSVISQNAYIFNMSIMDNLRVIKMDATDNEIKNACKVACIDEFIESLPDKYDTIVGEGGVTLSGGQKQRLAIARALLLKTEILLFDEATSALDNETQTKIQDAINNLKGEYTILIIAHRLSTIINADKIFVVDDGKILMEGTHNYLLKNCDVYKKLYSKEKEK